MDWELAGLGDPRWDLGCVFAEYLHAWLASIPWAGEDGFEASIGLAGCPLEAMQPAMKSFWTSYVRGMSLTVSLSAEWLLEAVRFAAARLVQIAIEWTDGSSRLTMSAALLLQFSLNVLRRPGEAMIHLLGFSPQGMVPIVAE